MVNVNTGILGHLASVLQSCFGTFKGNIQAEFKTCNCSFSNGDLQTKCMGNFYLFVLSWQIHL